MGNQNTSPHASPGSQPREKEFAFVGFALCEQEDALQSSLQKRDKCSFIQEIAVKRIEKLQQRSILKTTFKFNLSLRFKSQCTATTELEILALLSEQFCKEMLRAGIQMWLQLDVDSVTTKRGVIPECRCSVIDVALGTFDGPFSFVSLNNYGCSGVERSNESIGIVLFEFDRKHTCIYFKNGWNYFCIEIDSKALNTIMYVSKCENNVYLYLTLKYAPRLLIVDERTSGNLSFDISSADLKRCFSVEPEQSQLELFCDIIRLKLSISEDINNLNSIFHNLQMRKSFADNQISIKDWYSIRFTNIEISKEINTCERFLSERTPILKSEYEFSILYAVEVFRSTGLKCCLSVGSRIVESVLHMLSPHKNKTKQT